MHKSFNPLIDNLPTVAHIGGRDYRIETDYRVTLAYIRLLHNKTEDNTDKALLGLALYFGPAINSDDVQELLDYIDWFIRLGVEREPQHEHKKQLFDILEDSGRIYAAFWQAYRIDLRHVRLHWWLFSELLEGLPKGTHLSDVIEIRGRKPEKWMDAAAKLELARIQKHYALKGEGEDDVMKGLFDSLMGAV